MAHVAKFRLLSHFDVSGRKLTAGSERLQKLHITLHLSHDESMIRGGTADGNLTDDGIRVGRALGADRPTGSVR